MSEDEKLTEDLKGLLKEHGVGCVISALGRLLQSRRGLLCTLYRKATRQIEMEPPRKVLI